MSRLIGKCLSSAIAFVILLACISSCKQSDVSETQLVRIAYHPAYQAALLQLIMLTGYLEDFLPDGVSVEWTMINSNTDARDSAVAGRVDIFLASVPEAIASLENGLPLAIVLNSVVPETKMYSSNPRIRSLDDIEKTDKIAIASLGGSFQLALMLIAKERYEDSKRFDSNYMALPIADMFGTVATDNSHVDCIVVGFPHTIRANTVDQLSLIQDITPYLLRNNLSAFIMANHSFYQSNPEIIEAFISAAQKSIDMMNEHPDDAAEILYEYYGGDVEFSDVVGQIVAAPPSLEVSEAAYNRVAELMHEIGIIPNPPKAFAELPNYENIPKVR